MTIPPGGGAPIVFPRIQGADVCGEIVAAGEGVDPSRIGARVITDNWLRDLQDPGNKDKTGYFGSERDGGFAEYTTIPSQNALTVRSELLDAELATFSCSVFDCRRHADPCQSQQGRYCACAWCFGRGWAARLCNRPNAVALV